MGEVWLAEDTRLLRMVAIKILPRDVAANPESRARLIREAQLAAQLNHPSIATVHAIEEHDAAHRRVGRAGLLTQPRIYKPVEADEIAALMRVRGGNPASVLQRTRHRWIAV